MSLDRPDVKVRFDAEYHRAIKRIADVKGVSMGEWIEGLVVARVRELVLEASLIAESADELGIGGNLREKSGKTGRDREGEGGR